MNQLEPPLTDATPAQRHHRITARFATTIAAVDDWDAPTPVPEWTARDIITHLST